MKVVKNVGNGQVDRSDGGSRIVPWKVGSKGDQAGEEAFPLVKVGVERVRWLVRGSVRGGPVGFCSPDGLWQ